MTAVEPAGKNANKIFRKTRRLQSTKRSPAPSSKGKNNMNVLVGTEDPLKYCCFAQTVATLIIVLRPYR